MQRVPMSGAGLSGETAGYKSRLTRGGGLEATAMPVDGAVQATTC